MFTRQRRRLLRQRMRRIRLLISLPISRRILGKFALFSFPDDTPRAGFALPFAVFRGCGERAPAVGFRRRKNNFS